MKLVKWSSILFACILAWANAVSAQGGYQIRTGDTLIIEVLEDASLNRATVVLPDGSFSFPYAGTLTAAGLTIPQVQTNIRDAIANNFASPPSIFVSVQPRQAEAQAQAENSGGPTIDIYLLGEVNAPGLAEVSRGTTFLQAIAVGGGVSRFAATKRLQLRRTDPRTGRQSVTQINYKALLEGAVMSNDMELKDGDVILVPERRLFE